MIAARGIGYWAARMGAGRDMALALAVVMVIAMLILPMPAWLLDMGLALSITFAVLVLMVALFIEKPLDLSAFPTILLIATLLRLGLNLASTRLILANGHQGPDAAGDVIAAFGGFLMGGETLIGITVFLILVTINFIVITKGAGRIAEVAARFSLDAMPGKQMAIDADLNAGMIDETTARARRAELEAESGFFGAMDGASKFVKGDAVAGLLITGINIVIGLIVGTTSHGLPLAEAFRTYTLLTVGDGLVSQVPALIISVAAGLLVAKGGMTGRAGAALASQLGRFPRAFGLSSALLATLALLPGLPFIPFAALAALCGWQAWRGLAASDQLAAADAAAAAMPPAAVDEDTEMAEAVSMDPIRLTIGAALLPLLRGGGGERALDEQIRILRRGWAEEYGFILPKVRIVDDLALATTAYTIAIRGIEAGRGTADPTEMLVITADGTPPPLPGRAATEPVFGLPAWAISPALADAAAAAGLAAVDAATILMTHLTEVVRARMASLLDYDAVHHLVHHVHRGHAKLIADTIPARVGLAQLQQVLQLLLAEGVSIRDLPTIVEALGEQAGGQFPLAAQVEYVRARLARQISAQYADPAQGGELAAALLGEGWEAACAAAMVGDGTPGAAGRRLELAPSLVRQLAAELNRAWDRWASDGLTPVLLVSSELRPYIRAIAARARPGIAVLAQAEIDPGCRLRVVGSLTGPAAANLAAPAAELVPA